LHDALQGSKTISQWQIAELSIVDYLSESRYRLVIWSAVAGEHDTALAETVTRPVTGLGGEYVQNGLQTAGRGDGEWRHGDELACRPRFTL